MTQINLEDPQNVEFSIDHLKLDLRTNISLVRLYPSLLPGHGIQIQMHHHGCSHCTANWNEIFFYFFFFKWKEISIRCTLDIGHCTFLAPFTQVIKIKAVLQLWPKTWENHTFYYFIETNRSKTGSFRIIIDIIKCSWSFYTAAKWNYFKFVNLIQFKLESCFLRFFLFSYSILFFLKTVVNFNCFSSRTRLTINYNCTKWH